MCKLELEDVVHLFLKWPFVISTWTSVLNVLNISTDWNPSTLEACLLEWISSYTMYHTMVHPFLKCPFVISIRPGVLNILNISVDWNPSTSKACLLEWISRYKVYHTLPLYIFWGI